MGTDPVRALRLINNERLRRAQSCEYRDLGEALAITSDAPIPDLNCIEGFASTERTIESVLDIGFALLRAFDMPPAAFVTPLDRPGSIAERLARRGLVQQDRSVTLAFEGDAQAIAPNAGVTIRTIEAEEARVFADIQGAGEPPWMRKLTLGAALVGALEPGNTFYVASVEGQPAGTLHLVCAEGTAGIYAVKTLKAHRRKGVSTALMRRAIIDAHAAGCDVIGLRTLAGSDAERLYRTLGFAPLFESALWVTAR